jgi:hypothetical protein
MTTFSLRRRIGLALRQHADPCTASMAVAAVIAEVTQGAVRPRRGWVQGQLTPLVEGALDRAEGCMDHAALAISRDLAMAQSLDLVRTGVFDEDTRVLDWYHGQRAEWDAQLAG